MRRICPSKALREGSPGRDNSKGRGRAELVAGGTERRLVGRVNQGEGLGKRSGEGTQTLQAVVRRLDFILNTKGTPLRGLIKGVI